MEGLHFRKTTADDYDDVVSLRENLCDGLDYIPSRYHQYLDIFTGFGGYIGKEMVSFTFASVIDDGHSILRHATRVKKKYEGRGIATKMEAYCIQTLSNTAREEIFTTASPIVLEKLMQKASVNVIFQRNLMIFKTTLTAIKPLFKSKHMSPSLQTVDETYLKHIFSCPNASASLFPENKIIVARLPYNLIPSNTERIFKSVSKMLASGTKDNICKQKLPMISAATEDECAAGRVLFLDIFGDISNEKNTSDHIFIQTEIFLTSCKEEELVLYATFPTQQNTDTLYRILSEYTWTFVEKYIWYGVAKPI